MTITLVLVSLLSMALSVGVPAPAYSRGSSESLSSAIGLAMRWLASNQTANGSYGDFYDHWTAAAAYALWVNNSRSPQAALSYTWLADRLNNGSSWFWGQYGEADVPGAMLFSVAASQNLQLAAIQNVSSRLFELQGSNGGFRGYYDPNIGDYGQNVASSVDTAMALWALAEARAIDESRRQGAIEYLISLQNPNGSFNLTRTMASDPIYSHAPEVVSITALTLLALKAASYNTDTRVSKALDFLSTTTSSNFTGPDTSNSHVYSATLTALALNAFARTGDASTVIAFIVSHQNPDGGYNDKTRQSGTSNALDTGWAAIALQLVRTESEQAGNLDEGLRLNSVLIVGLIAAGVAVVVAGVSLYLRRTRPLPCRPCSRSRKE